VINLLLDTIQRYKALEAVGVTSVCSTHTLVLDARMPQSLDYGTAVLVERTANQVDRLGGIALQVTSRDMHAFDGTTGRRVDT
jgi:tagatose-1,6-bisphosphate aldolase non-catalytic subunit AgaZ/GatZ